MSDKLSQTARLLNLFQERGKLTNRYMADNICLRYSARIAELRAEGHIIVANRINEGLFEYIYQGQKDPEQMLEEGLAKVKEGSSFIEALKLWKRGK